MRKRQMQKGECDTDMSRNTGKIEAVITMGGLGARFRKRGYTVPKYMIQVKGKTLFEWAMISLEGYKTEICQYIFIARGDEKEDVEAFIKQQCNKLALDHYQIMILDSLTEGQAATAILGENYWEKDHGLLIYNIDTYVEAGEMNSAQLRGDGFIPCFKAKGDHWSFVRLDDEGQAVEVREKQRISDYCTLGAYYFKTCELYAQLYHEYYDDGTHLVNGERYVAPLYNVLIEKGGKVCIGDIQPCRVHVLGTPEELDRFAAEGL